MLFPPLSILASTSIQDIISQNNMAMYGSRSYIELSSEVKY